MITIPLYTLLFFYFIFLVVFVIFSIVNIYHIVASASFTMVSFVITLFSSIFALLIFYSTYHLLIGVDWSAPLISFDAGLLTNIFGVKSL